MTSVQLRIKVVPGASRNRVAGRYGDGVKVQVSAAPERGKANEAVVEVLAEWLGLKPGQIAVLSGHTQPRKIMSIQGLTQQTLNSMMEQLA